MSAPLDEAGMEARDGPSGWDSSQVDHEGGITTRPEPGFADASVTSCHLLE